MTDSADSAQRTWLLVAGAVVAAVLIGAVVFVATDDDDAGVATDSTSTTAQDTTTTAAPFVPDVDPYAVAHPGPLTSQRFESPDAAARSYSTDVLGFTELVQSEFREGDNRSGEIEITDRAGNPASTVLLRQMDDDTWYALGSVTEDVAVDRPQSGDPVRSPFETAGTALAFEGTVDVIVRTHGDPTPIGEGFVTGSGVPPAAAFAGEISFSPPDEETAGIVIYRTLSPEDGHVLQATSFPVRLQPA